MVQVKIDWLRYQIGHQTWAWVHSWRHSIELVWNLLQERSLNSPTLCDRVQGRKVHEIEKGKHRVWLNQINDLGCHFFGTRRNGEPIVYKCHFHSCESNDRFNLYTDFEAKEGRDPNNFFARPSNLINPRI